MALGAGALAALAGKFTSDEANEEVEPFLVAMNDVKNRSALVALSAGLGELAVELTDDQTERAVGPLLAAIRSAKEEYRDFLCQALGALPVRPILDSRTGFRHREWRKCWRLIKPDRRCGAKLL